MKKLLLIILFLASSAYGEIYTWKDSTGTAHYTNNQYEIPDRYRARSKVLDLGIEQKKDDSTSAQQNLTPQQNPSPVRSEQQLQPVKPAQPQAIQRPEGIHKRIHPARGRQSGRTPEE